jgi:peptidoglycan hydrolase-like protein with peptidoglycan-binding domain
LSGISPNFGDARGGGTRTHEGLDIITKKGTPVVSPTDAVIINTGNGPSSGLFISTMNPGGETFVYMHLDSFATNISSGTYVLRGQVIGFVGNTGNASGGGDHLHFEIRKNGATDPYLRIKKELSLSESLTSINTYLNLTSDSNLANTLSQNYSKIFNTARSQGISVHPLIQNIQNSQQTTTVNTSAAISGSIAALQLYLISQNAGHAAALLATYGATGNFGSITRGALSEFQAKVGINPASGNYGPITQSYISSHPISSQPSAMQSSTFNLTLSLGNNNDEVLLLQKFLNTKGYLIAASGPGSKGSETSYFGLLTQKALLLYQKDMSLNQSGTTDVSTRNILNKSY